MNTYCIATKNNRPINVFHDGSGPKIQVLKRACETYSTREEADQRLKYLSKHPNTAHRAAGLSVRRLTECGIVVP